MAGLGRILVRPYELVLGMGDGVQKGPFLVLLCVDVHLVDDGLHDGLLVISVVDGKAPLIADPVPVTPQNPHTG